MIDMDAHLQHCPRCKADMTPYKDIGTMPSFCLQCKFPLMLIAGKYQLQKVIGQGAVGTVYLSRHIRLNNNAERVVKVIKQDLLKHPNTIQRFLREVQVTADLSERNEHIIRIYDDFGQIPHLGYFYVMEYIRGASMRAFIQNQKQLPELSWCLEVIRQLCIALQAAHEAGVIHRDLKPDNLMLTEKSTSSVYLKVLDWGIAKPTSVVEEHLTQGLVGTPHYMAPEQAMNLDIFPCTDLYAVGVILYELLTGINPFVAVTGKKGKSNESMIDLIQAHLYEAPPPLLSLTPQRTDITPELERVIFKVLEKKPEDRYASASEFFAALQEAALASGVHVAPLQSGQFTHSSLASFSSGPVASTSSSNPQLRQAASDASVLSSSDSDEVLKTTISPSYPSAPPVSFETSEKQPIPPILIGSIIGVSALLLLVVGIFFGQKWTAQKQDKISKVQRQDTPKTRRTGSNIARTSTQEVRNPAPTPRKQKAVQPQPVQVRKRTQPPTRPQTRKQPVQRRVLRRRARRRSVARPKRRSLCPAGNWLPIYIQPSLASSAEMTAEPGRIKRMNSKLLCITQKTRQVSLVQEGFAPCVFRVPRNRKALRIRLQTAGSGGLSGQCLRSR